ncbi:hypothetical protein [Psychrobacter sp. 4Bb]|uniref:hypothetical protein n=1 Tax=Psychrobacter sp. 4Bb TaxID=888436 RepID=UPI000C7D361D|nr:hypothetical protein [Psychrobacter sp. 4Bb]PKH82084.1 hypothetical protein CXF60_02800 [Psychrobacter sp. 4Bb]
MKDYKLLLAGLILLLLTIFIAVFIWLWTSNQKNTDPLPIMASESEADPSTKGDESREIADIVLYIRAEEKLQIPLDDIIVSFESRYPHVQVLASYVPSHDLLTVPSNGSTKDKLSDFVFDTDMIITNDDSLSTERVSLLQSELQQAQDRNGQSQKSTEDVGINDASDKNSDNSTHDKDKKIHTLNPFNYALKDEQALEGVILTDDTTAINFRNFLLSSTGQDILKKYDYENISGYKNSVNDLFKPTSQAKNASGDHAVDVTDALSNGE